MRKMMTLLLCFFLLAAITGCTGQAVQTLPSASPVKTAEPQESIPAPTSPTPTPEDIVLRTFSLAQMQEDFKQLQAVIESTHPKLYTDKKELEQAFKTQYGLIKDGMNEAEFYRVLAPVNAAIRCHHTVISTPTNLVNYMNEKGKFLPAGIQIIKGRAYVYESFFPSDLQAGVEVVSINGKKIPDLIQSFMKNLQGDGANETEKLRFINLGFAEMYYLFAETPENFAIQYKDAGTGEIKTAALPAVEKAQLTKTLKSFIPFQERKVTLLDQEFQDKYAVLTVKSFGASNEFDSFMDTFFKTLAEKKIQNLIIDVRDNWGGEPERAAYLFSYLTRKAVPFMSGKYGESYILLEKPVAPAANAFKGKVYVLINGGCNSSTGFFCALLKYHKIATFIGEETGGGGTCMSMAQNILLKNTGFSFQCATQVYGVAIPGKPTGRGTMPDHTIIPTIQDMIGDKDTVKDHALSLIRKGEE